MPEEHLKQKHSKHLLMANIFKLHKYQTFSFMKMHNINQF